MEKKISKINLKKQRIRSTIFSGICISRQELIRQTGFSGRTVDNYTNELKRHGLILEEIAEGQRGRPGIIYRSNSERIIFVSVSLFTGKLCFAVIDINSYLLYSNVLIIPEPAPSTDVIRLSLEEIQNIRNRFPDMAVAAIGCNLNTYRQDSRRSLQFRELVKILRRLYGIHVELMEDSELVFRRLYKSLLLKGNAGLFVPGSFSDRSSRSGRFFGSPHDRRLYPNGYSQSGRRTAILSGSGYDRPVCSADRNPFGPA